ncbi:hypothetical protein [Streptomyces cacaoi]|uniref:hypothetical protein n=1 Tax=Streptomyces cacaoi TaxID=1898 RepID=UPI0026043372|nr:hypothetical protein [Streptomyces cacaoi]
MLLAIGDVVRDRRDDALGTVAGLAYGSVVLKINGADELIRSVPSKRVEMVARAFRPRTPTADVLTLLFIALGTLVGALVGISVARLGGALLLTLTVTVSTAAAATHVLTTTFLRPRRARV